MKKLLPILLFVFTCSFVKAQFSENFEGVTLTSGTGMLPSGWTQQNVDGLTPYTSFSYMGTNAWVVRTAPTTTGTTKAALSISWYTPAGQSNDWMITPHITVPASNPYLLFKALAPDGNYPDGYVVKISTTGNAVANFTTTLLTVPAAGQTFETKIADLSAYAGQQVYIAFINNSNDMYVLYLDDVEVKSLPANDVELNAVGSAESFVSLNTPTTIFGTFTNRGYAPLTSVTIDWNDGTAHGQTLTGLNVTSQQSYSFTHGTTFSKGTVDEFPITVTLSNPNSVTDPTPANNTGAMKINTISSIPVKNVVMEEGTGTWCGWCPRGKVVMDAMTAAYPNTFIGIAVHNSDPMTVTAYDGGANFSGYPSANIDRTILDAGITQDLVQQYYDSRITKAAPAGIVVSSTIAGQQLTVNLTANFVTKLNGDYRFAAVVIENGVTGTGTTWDQHNYYAGGSNGAMGGFENLTDPVPAASMVYDHVGRALLGGYSGQASSIPASVNDLQAVNYSFNYTVPTTSVMSHLSVAGFLVENSTGRILNAAKAAAGSSSTSIDAIKNSALAMNIYPNPIGDNNAIIALTLNETENVRLDVYNLTGQLVSSENYGKYAAGNHFINFNSAGLSQGLYNFNVTIGNQTISKKVSVIK